MDHFFLSPKSDDIFFFCLLSASPFFLFAARVLHPPSLVLSFRALAFFFPDLFLISVGTSTFSLACSSSLRFAEVPFSLGRFVSVIPRRAYQTVFFLETYPHFTPFIRSTSFFLLSAHFLSLGFGCNQLVLLFFFLFDIEFFGLLSPPFVQIRKNFFPRRASETHRNRLPPVDWYQIAFSLIGSVSSLVST